MDCVCWSVGWQDLNSYIRKQIPCWKQILLLWLIHSQLIQIKYTNSTHWQMAWIFKDIYVSETSKEHFWIFFMFWLRFYPEMYVHQLFYANSSIIHCHQLNTSPLNGWTPFHCRENARFKTSPSHLKKKKMEEKMRGYLAHGFVLLS